MVLNKLIIVGEVLPGGPTLRDSADGLPSCRLLVRLQECDPDGRPSRLTLAVELESEHALWVARRLRPGDLVLIDGTLAWQEEPTSPEPTPRQLYVRAWQVTPLVASPA